MRALLLAGGLVWSACAAAADFPGGVYAPSQELCAAGLAGGIQSIFERGDTVLTAAGIEGIEYHCDFVQVLEGRRTPGFVVTALCEEPDFAFPDLLAIVPRGEDELQVTSVLDAAGGEPSANSGTYHRCKGLELP